MKAIIHVWLKNDILDPQGTTIMKTLQNMAFNEVSRVRQGKVFELNIDENDRDKAHKRLINMCKKLLANEVIENYHITFNN